MFERIKKLVRKLRRRLGRKMKVLNTIELSKKALIHNYKFFKQMHPESEICPVLKSNAYGHGLIAVAKILQPLKPPYIVVDSFYEVFKLQQEGIRIPMLIIGYTHPDNFKAMRFKNVAIAVTDFETIKTLGKLKKHIKIHLKVDTGMHRQGIPFKKAESALRLIRNYKTLKLEGICTHLADGDNANTNDYTQHQVENFREVLEMADEFGMKVKWKHISATAGAGKIFSDDFNMVRLGLGLYGESPLDVNDTYYKKDKLHELKPVLRFNSTIIDIKRIKKGDCLSYGCTFQAEKDMMIGIIPVGYHEGVSRRLSNKGIVYYNDTPCKILGRVCMNLTIIDLTHIKEPKKWDKVEVIGRERKRENSAYNISKMISTIPYTVWTGISPTIRRVIE